MKKVKKFSKIFEEYGPESMTVGELSEKLTQSNDENFVFIKIEEEGEPPVTANVKNIRMIKVDKNRWDVIIEGIKTGM